MVSGTYLTVGRDVFERSIIQDVFSSCGVPQLGVAFYISGGKFHSHGLGLCWIGRIEIMVALKYHKLFL